MEAFIFPMWTYLNQRAVNQHFLLCCIVACLSFSNICAVGNLGVSFVEQDISPLYHDNRLDGLVLGVVPKSYLITQCAYDCVLNPYCESFAHYGEEQRCVLYSNSRHSAGVSLAEAAGVTYGDRTSLLPNQVSK